MNHPRLHRAIEALYTTFVGYPLRTVVEGCPCCVDVHDQARIHSQPLRELSEPDLSRYMWKAMTTWGNQDDFKHFLPRILELIACEAYGNCPEVVIGKLEYANWRNWPSIEQAVVENYFLELWRAFLASFPSDLPNFFEVSDCLGAITQVIGDLVPFLTLWQHHPSVSALRHLAQFAIVTCQGHSARSFWYQPSWRQVNVWLFSPTIINVIEQSFFHYADEPFADEFAEAHSLLLLAQQAPTMEQ